MEGRGRGSQAGLDWSSGIQGIFPVGRQSPGADTVVVVVVFLGIGPQIIGGGPLVRLYINRGVSQSRYT